MTSSPVRAALIPLFLVSAGAVGFENALTRYFAVAKWSEYGYWVISIVMAGFALSGVAAALFRRRLERWGPGLRLILPALLVLSAAAGFHWTALNPFNPLQLQNPATWLPQIQHIGAYYLELLPFFFLTGIYISLAFILNTREIGRVYAYDLIGAGIGSAVVLGLMFLVHPFLLVPALLVPLALSAAFQPGKLQWLGALAALMALAGGEVLLLRGEPPQASDFKAIYAPLHTPGAKVAAEILSPRGVYQLLDDFTERVDAELSNNAGTMGLAGPPRAYGLYRDGVRIGALPRPGPLDLRYGPASLDAAAYRLESKPKVLLVGASGGFRIGEALALGASRLDVLEAEPALHAALKAGLGPSPAPLALQDPRVRLLPGGPLAAVLTTGADVYDLIDISADALDASEANETAFSAEAVAASLRALKPGGVLSIPVSIRDFPVYAIRALATVRDGLKMAGVSDPTAHVLVYRSDWSVRILVAPRPFAPDRVETLRAFCDRLSFDVSYYPGVDVKAARTRLYNDLPQVSFVTGRITSQGPDDAIADEAGAVLAGQPPPSAEAFNLRPMTLDRPAVHAVLRLDQPSVILQRLEVLPQAEIGAVVNLVVLAQAILIAFLVLIVPRLAPRQVRAPSGRLWPLIYFPALGLGFLFIELFMIEKAALFLNDRMSAFAVVLTAMLVFSGLGSALSGRLKSPSRIVIALACLLAAAWAAAMFRWSEPQLLQSLDLPWAERGGAVLAVLAPVSLALGMPFPLGLRRIEAGGSLPWAWGLNGAFSVVATPLANLMSRELGQSSLLVGAAGLYLIALLAAASMGPAPKPGAVPA